MITLHASRRLVASAAIGAAAALLLTACGDSSSTEETSAAASAPASSAPAASATAEAAAPELATSGTVNLIGWVGKSVVDGWIAEFNKTYPDITVNYRFVDYGNYAATLRPALSAGAGVDVFALQPGAITSQFASFGDDLTPVAEQVLGTDWSTKIATLGTDAFTADGQLKAFPVGLGGAGTLLVNKTMLDELGVPLPTAATTLDELKAACETLAAADKGCLGVGAKDQWQTQDLLQSIAESVAPGKFREAVAGTVPWTDPDLVEAMTIFQQMFTDGIVQEGAVAQAGYPDMVGAWLKQDLAMALLGTWELMEYKEETLVANMQGAGVSDPTAFTALLTAFPDVAGRGNVVPIFSDPDQGMAINANSENKEAAKTFVSWLSLQQEGQQYLADTLTTVPVLSGVAAQPTGLVDEAVQTPSLAEITTAVQQSTVNRAIPYAELITALGDAGQSLATGESPQDVAQTLQTASEGVQRS